jgi:hypothetical protein
MLLLCRLKTIRQIVVSENQSGQSRIENRVAVNVSFLQRVA